MANFRSLLETLSKLTHGRTLTSHTHEQISDVTRIRIPIRILDKEDRAERVAKRYIRDWLKKNLSNIAIDVRLKKEEAKFQGKSVQGYIEVNFWPAAPPDYQNAAWS